MRGLRCRLLLSWESVIRLTSRDSVDRVMPFVGLCLAVSRTSRSMWCQLQATAQESKYQNKPPGGTYFLIKRISRQKQREHTTQKGYLFVAAQQN